MEYKFSDSRPATEKEKKYYTTSTGERLNLTWKPSIIDRLYKEYIEIQLKVYEGYDNYVKMLDEMKKKSEISEEDKQAIADYVDMIDLYEQKCYLIILTALKANDIIKDEDWLETLVSEEKDMIVRLIMDIPEQDFKTKKK